MADKIREALGLEAELVRGERGVFDVHVDGELLYSKFETMSFPDAERDVIEPLRRRMG